jgi:transcriptional regulator with XRE-family HTH domain
MCGFDELLDRLRKKLQTQVRNGELTERGLARRLGLSQPHMHNILKGVRQFRPEVADRVLKEQGLSIADLLSDEEIPRRPAGSHRLADRATTASR